MLIYDIIIYSNYIIINWNNNWDIFVKSIYIFFFGENKNLSDFLFTKFDSILLLNIIKNIIIQIEK